MESSKNPLIIGAGPAGLSAALALTKKGVIPRIFEESAHIGGLARTPVKDGWRVDPGGHRFFTKHEEILELWNELLPPDQWIGIQRNSAMLVDGHLVPYPLVGRNLLKQLGFQRGLRGLGSLLWARARRGARLIDESASFRDWGTDEFGHYWYKMFFDGYVRKTWHLDPGEIASDWANQRIKPIDWRLTRESAEPDVFRYPRLGPGQLWEAAAERIAAAGTPICLNSQIVKVRYDTDRWTVKLHNGETASGDAVFSSMPLRLLVEALDPAPPKHIRAVAATLKHRGLVSVAVALKRNFDLPFNWIYTPDNRLRVGRIQNYAKWSPALAPAGFSGTHLGFEYFVAPGNELRPSNDEDLSSTVERDLKALGVDVADVEHVMIVRSQFAYPIRGPIQDRSVALIRNYLRHHYPSLHAIGRNGMHRYDNQDHAMLSAMYSVARYFGENVDPWQVNTGRGYHEHGLLRG
jgi:protoporphyrinogen oxidase